MTETQKRIKELVANSDRLQELVDDMKINASVADRWIRQNKAFIMQLVPDLFVSEIASKRKELESYGKTKTIGYWYDDIDHGDNFSGLVLDLMPTFEYPEWEEKTVGEFLEAL